MAIVVCHLSSVGLSFSQGLVQDPPQGRKDGVSVLSPVRAHFQLRAPSKDHVHLRGDFNAWQVSDDHLMNRSLDGNTWWLEVDNLQPGEWTRFHYLVDDTVEVADPYSPLILDPWNDVSSRHLSWPLLIFGLQQT